MTDSPSLLSIENLSVGLASDIDEPALIEDFQLHVGSGSSIGIVGETGAGKSLSMRASVGLLPEAIVPRSGKARFRGEETQLRDTTAARKHLGKGICLLLQNGRSALNPYMRVSAQVSRALKYQGVPSRMRAAGVERLLDAVGLTASEFAHRYPHQLSGGQAQRVAMVIALATEPEILIADEPTTALDVTTERDVIDMLKSLCRNRGMALVLISHNLNLVANACDTVVIMHAGHIVERASALVIFGAPKHPYTKALLNAIPDADFPRPLVPMRSAVDRLPRIAAGCRFAGRCDMAMDMCHRRVPPITVTDGHAVRCFLFGGNDDQDSRVKSECRTEAARG